MSERRRPPNRAQGVTARLEDERPDGGSLVVHARVDLYDDGFPCQLFLAGPKPGSPVANLLEDVGVLVSVAVQHGVPISAYTRSIARLPVEGEALDRPGEPGKRRAASIVGQALDYLGSIYETAAAVKAGKGPLPAEVAEEVARLRRLNALRKG